MGRQFVLSLVVAVAVLAAAGGVVLSVSKTCSATDCVGTREADTLNVDNTSHQIAGLEGSDLITGGLSDDTIYGDEGNDTIDDHAGSDSDTIYGDEGNDTIDVREDGIGADFVDCGPGRKDKVFFDEGIDTVSRCEIKNPKQ